MTEMDHLGEVFFELHRDLPREGPGDDESTLRALALCTELPERPAILDVGCGPGMQTLALAGATKGTITAVDLHEPFLEQLRNRAEAAGVRDRIQIMRGDMADLPFGADSFDLVWCEGAAYIMGVGEALTAWRRFLRPGGYIVFSELTWLVPDVPDEPREFFTKSYPGVRGIEGNLERIRAADFEVIDHFTLPAESWWTHYQTPLDARVPGLLQKYAGDEEALAVIGDTIDEHGIRRRYPDAYGYEFFITRCACPEGPAPKPEPERVADEAAPDQAEGGEADGEPEAAEVEPEADEVEPGTAEPKPEYPPPLD